jgi:hypothetical protein
VAGEATEHTDDTDSPTTRVGTHLGGDGQRADR